MATNWVKDGLDAYLSLTGEKRAQDKADEDRVFRQKDLDLKQGQFDLTKAASGLTNQLAQQQIDKGKQEAASVDWYRNLFYEGVKKEIANPMTPTGDAINDPAKVDMSKYVYGNSLKTADYIKTLPLADFSIPFAQLQTKTPQFVQDTAKNIFVPAAMKRAGQESVDPVTGQKGILTGNMGHLNIAVDPQSGERYISADMEVKNEDGTIRYAPFTNGTDDPNQPVKIMPVSAMQHEANSVLQGIEDAQKTGVAAEVAITHRKISSLANAPPEVLKAEYESLRKHKENLQIRESYTALMNKLTPEQKTAFGEGGQRMFEVGAALGMSPDKIVELAQKSAESAESRTEKLNATAAENKANREARAESDRKHNETIRAIASDNNAARKDTNNREKISDKKNIDVRIRDANRAHNALLKEKADPDAINASIDYIEQLNEDAKDVGATPLPVPKRPYMKAEEISLNELAIKRLTKKGVLWGENKPSKKDVLDEIIRLKRIYKPGAVPSADAQQEISAEVPARPAANNTATVNSTGHTDFPQSQGTQKPAQSPRPQASQQVTAVATKVVNGLPYFKGSDGKWYEGPR